MDDVSTKIPKEDLRLVNELQMGLRKRDIKMTQKELIDKAIKFSFMENRQDFVKMLKMDRLKRKMRGDKILNAWLNNGVEIEGDILEEHDILL